MKLCNILYLIILSIEMIILLIIYLFDKCSLFSFKKLLINDGYKVIYMYIFICKEYIILKNLNY